MPKKKVSFEDNLQKLETIVNQLESGDVPLDKALDQFKDGVKLSNKLQSTLSNAENTLTKMMTNDGKEVPYDRDKNGQDVNNSVGGNQGNDQR
ncbi:exodeoxyribonuclease VII small subunit [Acetilactobacillus jinshanensis]|uniref:Exodeoxyribonuclease 7 small subunit n=1 Tax=Acetilactobacillus jinshanensis TaxID=1720083 RepID=A0A4P6ZLK3_9LACO|nr:exodeoxyribonuclease VII small subunit [Acetilactobacillus jinshanensis]QBP18634.1 exodeoxyribonuclease VII small subunit [Acetilactobacillus jinshanensis]URL61510.1 exodeoxyribonuclease VII small subunit [uncultured bacterium]